MWRRAALLAGAVLCFAGALFVLISTGLPERAHYTGLRIDDQQIAAPELNALAPPFEAPLLDGGRIRTADLRGSLILLNFWATWCVPCEAEMPVLQALQDDYRMEGVRVLAVNTGETPAAIIPWLRRLQLNLEIVLDPELRLSGLYTLRGQPTTFVIDRAGVIREIIFGAATYEMLRDAIVPYLDS